MAKTEETRRRLNVEQTILAAKKKMVQIETPDFWAWILCERRNSHEQIIESIESQSSKEDE